MRIALIHNPKAGDDNQPAGEDVLELLRSAGHEVTEHSSKDDHLAALLDEAPHLVAVSGGDGTVGKVAQIMLGRDIPLAALPTGTANNIARALGVADIALDAQIAAWPTWHKLPFNIGLARGPWGSRHFVESVGAGLLAWIIPKASSSAMLARQDDAEGKIEYARKMLADRIRDAKPVHCEATLDGKDISGDYLLLEAMNISCVGPNVALAPDADPRDGLLDVVAVPRDALEALRRHLAGGNKRPPDLPTHRGRELCIEWTGFELHFDDDIWPDGRPVASESTGVDIKLEDEHVEFLVPA